MFTDPQTGEITNGIVKTRYTHDAMIDLIIAEPTIKQNDLAVIFDRTPTWVSQIMSSDAFQARLSERKAELIDPVIVASIQERIQAVASASLDKMLNKLTSPLPVSDDFLIKSAKLATDALGYGARSAGGSTTNVAVVLQVPQKIASTQEWVTRATPQG
jgi:hypothetical protein